LFGGFPVLFVGCGGRGGWGVSEQAVVEIVAFVAAAAYAWGFGGRKDRVVRRWRGGQAGAVDVVREVRAGCGAGWVRRGVGSVVRCGVLSPTPEPALLLARDAVVVGNVTPSNVRPSNVTSGSVRPTSVMTAGRVVVPDGSRWGVVDRLPGERADAGRDDVRLLVP
jgi:hypothetical protein